MQIPEASRRLDPKAPAQLGSVAMKVFSWIVGCLIALVLLIHFAFPTRYMRWRLSVAIETPAGPKIGSGIYEARSVDTRWNPLGLIVGGPPFEISDQGEAFLIDLGENKHVIVLMTNFILTQDGTVDLLCRARHRGPCKPEDWHNTVYGKPIKLTTNLVPVLVLMKEMDPSTLELIFGATPRSDPLSTKHVDEFRNSLGAGYAFKEAWVELVPASTPQAKSIERQLPWLKRGPSWPLKVPDRLHDTSTFKLGHYRTRPSQYRRSYR